MHIPKVGQVEAQRLLVGATMCARPPFCAAPPLCNVVSGPQPCRRRIGLFGPIDDFSASCAGTASRAKELERAESREQRAREAWWDETSLSLSLSWEEERERKS